MGSLPACRAYRKVCGGGVGVGGRGGVCWEWGAGGGGVITVPLLTT